MKTKVNQILDFLLGRISEDLRRHIARENMFVLRLVAMIVTILEGWLLISSFALLQNKPEALRWNMISLTYCIAVSAITWIASRIYLAKPSLHSLYPRVVIVGYYVLLVLWSMNVSFKNYRQGFQMLTFYIVQFCFASFTVLPPVVSLVLYGVTYVFFHYALFFYDGAVNMNPFNYFALAIMTIIASWIHYNISIRSFEKTVEMARLNEELKSLSRMDDLTGLKNRVALRQDAFEYVAKDLIVMMADLDSFKQLNDTYGHAVGDRVLEAYSAFLVGRFGQDHVYRFGGDEFLIVMYQEEMEQFQKGIEGWENGMDSIQIKGRADLKVNGSGGYTTGRGTDQEAMKALIRAADAALYEAKNSGKNKVCAG